jgi:hypothetical protein
VLFTLKNVNISLFQRVYSLLEVMRGNNLEKYCEVPKQTYPPFVHRFRIAAAGALQNEKGCREELVREGRGQVRFRRRVRLSLLFQGDEDIVIILQ